MAFSKADRNFKRNITSTAQLAKCSFVSSRINGNICIVSFAFLSNSSQGMVTRESVTHFQILKLLVNNHWCAEQRTMYTVMSSEKWTYMKHLSFSGWSSTSVGDSRVKRWKVSQRIEKYFSCRFQSEMLSRSCGDGRYPYRPHKLLPSSGLIFFYFRKLGISSRWSACPELKKKKFINHESRPTDWYKSENKVLSSRN
jgi:hypothetical protein